MPISLDSYREMCRISKRDGNLLDQTLYALCKRDDVPLAVEGGEQLLMKTPYPTFLFSARCPSLGSSKYAWSIQSSL